MMYVGSLRLRGIRYVVFWSPEDQRRRLGHVREYVTYRASMGQDQSASCVNSFYYWRQLQREERQG